MKFFLVCVGVLSAGFARGQMVFPKALQEIPALVVLGAHEGTGFFVNYSNRVFFVTAKHVLFDVNNPGMPLWSDRAQIYYHSRDSAMGEADLSVSLQDMLNHQKLRAHPTHDVACFFMEKETGTNHQISIYVEMHSTNRLTVIPDSMFQKFENVSVGTDIYGFGYPTSIGIPETPQLNAHRALARKGIIADTDSAKRTLVLDLALYQGNSGGPVIECIEPAIGIQEYRLVGIAVQFIPFRERWINDKFGYANTTYSNSGYSIAEPVDSLLEILWPE